MREEKKARKNHDIHKSLHKFVELFCFFCALRLWVQCKKTTSGQQQQQHGQHHNMERTEIHVRQIRISRSICVTRFPLLLCAPRVFHWLSIQRKSPIDKRSLRCKWPQNKQIKNTRFAATTQHKIHIRRLFGRKQNVFLWHHFFLLACVS